MSLGRGLRKTDLRVKKIVVFKYKARSYSPFQPWLTLSQDLARPQPLKITKSVAGWRKDLGAKKWPGLKKRVHNLKTNLGHSWTLPAGLCLCGKSITTVLKTLDNDHFLLFCIFANNYFLEFSVFLFLKSVATPVVETSWWGGEAVVDKGFSLATTICNYRGPTVPLEETIENWNISMCLCVCSCLLLCLFEFVIVCVVSSHLASFSSSSLIENWNPPMCLCLFPLMCLSLLLHVYFLLCVSSHLASCSSSSLLLENLNISRCLCFCDCLCLWLSLFVSLGHCLPPRLLLLLLPKPLHIPALHPAE